MMNANDLKGKTRQMKDWRRRLVALVAALTLLISSCGLTAFAESDDDIYSAPVTAPIAPENTSPAPEDGGAEATPAPENGEETGTEPGEEPGEETGEETGTETEGEPEVSEEPEDLSAYESGTLVAEADGVGVTLDYTPEARIPEGTVLTLARAAGGDLYSAMKSAARVLKEEQNETWQREMGDEAVFYLLTLTNPEGIELHPTSGITFTCVNLPIPAGSTGFVTGTESATLDWDTNLTLEYLPEAIGYATLKQVQTGTITLVHNDRDYMVTASYGPEAGFPYGTALKVREIMPGTPEYALYSGMTDEALNEDWSEITLERYFDISFVKGDVELEPQGDVDVQITFRDKIEENEDTEVAAVHIENNEATVIESETDSQKVAKHDDEAIDTVTFTSDSFSVFGVVQKKKIITKLLEAGGQTYEIGVTYTQEAEIPEDAQIKVEEIPEGSDLYNAYKKQTAAALNADDVRLPGLYDISIVDAENNKVEPKVPVSVAIKLLNDEYTTEDIQIVHFTEEMPQELVEAEAKPEETPETIEQTTEQTEVQSEPLSEEDKIASETIEAKVEADNTITFDTQSFSVYAFAYTVDFYYGEYEYHLDGGTYMSLKNLLTILHIVEEDQVQEFVNNIADVTFTNPALLSVSKVEEDTTVGELIKKLGVEPFYSVLLSETDITAVNETEIKAIDWALISLEAFTSHESLTIIMKNGDRHTISVDDAQSDFKVYVNYEGAGYLVPTSSYNFINSSKVQNVDRPDGTNVGYYEHVAGNNNYGVNAVAKSGFEFAFWAIVHSDKTVTKITNATLAATIPQNGDTCVACFIGAGDKLIVLGEPEPVGAAWFWAGTRYSGGNQTCRNAYNRNELRYAVLNECYLFHTEPENKQAYNFLGWFDGDTLVSRGNDDFQHEYDATGLDHNILLTPKYELKEQYRDYRIVWFDGSDGVSSNSNDTTTLANITQFGERVGAGQEMQTVTAGTKIHLPTSVSFSMPISNDLHHYQLDGWYDIKTGQFYAPGAEVQIDHDTVFYASWFPGSYNFANGSGAISTRDTSGFITMNLYDYNSIYNMKWLNLDSDSYITSTGHFESWTIKGTADDFIFLTTQGQTGRSINPKGINNIRNRNNEAGQDNEHYNAWSANIVMPGDLTNGNVPGVKSVGSANYLFQYDSDTGYYYYDSTRNKAAYGNGRFYVYPGTEKAAPNYGTSDFLPFNNGQSSYNEPQGEPNYWFGMDTRIQFYLPDQPGTTNANRSTTGDEMVYKFSGDDDVWIYVDNELILNMSGIHGLIYGEINFSTGKYTLVTGGVSKTEENGIMSYGAKNNGSIDTYDLPAAIGSGEHTLRMVYLERGASQSNCAIYFNLAPKSQKVKLRKNVDRKNGTKYVVQGAEFQIYTEDNYLNINNGGQPINADETKQLDEMEGYYYGHTFVSDTVGRFFMGELPIGVYYIVETSAPHGLSGIPLADAVRIKVTNDKVLYGPQEQELTPDGEGFVNVYIENTIEKGSIKVEKIWDESLAQTEAATKAILFTLERAPELDVYGAKFGAVTENPTAFGLTADNVYDNDGTLYLKLNKNGSTWETLEITNLPMACISSQIGLYDTYPVVPCYYRVVEAGFLGNDNTFIPINPVLHTVTYSGTNAVEIDGHTAILAKKTNPDKLTITNKSDFTTVDVLKTWANDNAYADSVTVKLYRIAETTSQGTVSTTATVHLKVTLTDENSKASTVFAHIDGQDYELIKNGNEYTRDVVLNKGQSYSITFTGTANDGYTVFVENDSIDIGQNAEQNYNKNGTVIAPQITVSRSISLTIDWDDEEHWNYKDQNQTWLWAQLIAGNNENGELKTGIETFHAYHLMSTVTELDGNVYQIRIGDLDKSKWDVSINNSGTVNWSTTGSDRLYIDIPAGSTDLSYTLTISKKSNSGNNGTPPAAATISFYNFYNNPPTKQPQTGVYKDITADTAGQQIRVGDTVKIYYTGWAGNLREDLCEGISNLTNVVTFDGGIKGFTSPIGFTVTDSTVKLMFEFSSTTNITKVEIVPSNSSSLPKPLRFRAEAGGSTEPSPVVTTITLSHSGDSAGTTINYPAGQPEISAMEQVGTAVTLDSGNSWYYKWENMPAVDENGYRYHYYVIEDVPNNTKTVDYVRTETAALTSVKITNTPSETPVYATFSVNKVVTGTITTKDFYIKLKREKNSTTEWLHHESADTWSWGTEGSATEFSFKDGGIITFTGLDVDGYTYTVVEDTGRVDITGFSYTSTSTDTNASVVINTADDYTGTITNKYTPQKGSISITKKIDGVDAKGTYSIAIKDGEGNYYNDSGVNNGTSPFYVNFAKDETKTWSNLPVPQTYYIEEADANVVGYLWTVDTPDSITLVPGQSANVDVTNKYESGYRLIVKKEWQNHAGTVVTGTQSITFKLIRHENGTTTGATQTTSAEAATITFNQRYSPYGKKVISEYSDGTAIHVGDTIRLKWHAYFSSDSIEFSGISGFSSESYDYNNGVILEFKVENASASIKTNLNIPNELAYPIEVTALNAVGGTTGTTTTTTATATETVLKRVTDGENVTYVPDSTGNTVFTLAPGATEEFDNLPWDNGAGTTYTYEVVETPVSGYTTTYRPDATYDPTPDVEGETGKNGEITIVNRDDNDGTDYGHLVVKKVVVGYDPMKVFNIGVKDSEGNYYDYNGTNKGTETFYLQIEAGKSKTWSNLNPGTYTVEEDETGVTGYSLVATGTGNVEIARGETKEVTVTNTFRYPLSVTATKHWDSDDPRATAVQFTLMRQAGPEGKPMEVPATETYPNPVTVTRTTGWIATWGDLDRYYNDQGMEYSYFVTETAVYYGDLTSEGQVPDDGWINDTSFTYESGSSVSFDANWAGTVTIRNKEKINVPVSKSWGNKFTDSKYTWAVDFKLQKREELVKGDATASDAVADWEDVDGEGTTLHITNNTELSGKQFTNLDLFRIGSNGNVYKIFYRAKETAYEVKKNENGTETTVAKWVEGHNEETVKTEGLFEAYYAQNAGEEMTLTELRDRYSIFVENREKIDYEGKLVIHKEWLDIYPEDLQYYPGVKVFLYSVPIHQYVPAEYDSYGPDDYKRAVKEGEYILDNSNQWTWVVSDLDEGYKYFVIEEPLEVKPEHNIKDDNGTVRVSYGVTIKTYPSVTEDPSMAPTVELYKARDIYQEGDWRTGNYEQSVCAYTGNTGEILIQNNTPTKYMQMDLKKKFLEYRLDSNGVYSLWTTTAEYDTMDNMIIEIQIMRRKVLETKDGDVQLNEGKWEPYGNTVFVGYDANHNEVKEKNGNLFDIVSGDGTWHFRIPCDEQHEGLPRRGYEKIGDNYRIVRYQYILKEVQVYNGSWQKIGDDWAAWLPWYWDGIKDTPYQAEEHSPATAQDQDRLFNTPGTKLYIEKIWNIPASQVPIEEIYVQVFRKLIKTGEVENYIDVMLQNAGSGLEYDHMEGNPKGTLDAKNSWLVLSPSNDWSAVLHKVQISDKDVNNGEYEYYLVEAGYKDASGPHTAAEAEAKFHPNYSGEVDGENQTLSTGNHGMVLKWQHKNTLKINNTLDVVSIPFEKQWTGGNPGTNAEVDIELYKVVNDADVFMQKLTLKADDDPDKNWKGIFIGLDKLDSNNNPITYKVKETRVAFNGAEYTGDNLTRVFGTENKEFTFVSNNISGSSKAVFENPIEKKNISVEKQWNSSDTWPEKMSVTFTISKKVGENGTWEPMAESTEIYGANTPSVTVSSGDAVKTVAWTNLPKWEFVNLVATEVFYKVEETSVKYDGTELAAGFGTIYTVETSEPDDNGLVTINNIPQITERHATKTWDDAGFEDLRPTQIKFTLVATANNKTLTAEELVAEGIISQDQPAEVTISAPTTGTTWGTANWTNLPVYTKAGYLITYDVTEAKVDHYTSGSTTSGTTISFTNTPAKTNIKIVKVKKDSVETLNGAIFQLKREQISKTDPSKKEFVNYGGQITVDGEATISNLPDGNYELEEVKAPDGYNRLNTTVTFTITDGAVTESNADDQTIRYSQKAGNEPDTFTIENTPGSALPATGGSGTLIYTIAGMALIVLAGVLLVSRRRRSEH